MLAVESRSRAAHPRAGISIPRMRLGTGPLFFWRQFQLSFSLNPGMLWTATKP
jgi:hypothetical protein